MRAELDAAFRRRFAAAADVVARAPGRVNLIGEHTDYNEGLVLPCAVDRFTWVAACRRDGSDVRIHSREFDAQEGFDSESPRRSGDWVDYAKGVFAALRERGVRTGGFDLSVASEVPVGSGLSSSAAFTVALVTAIDRCLALGLDARARSEVAHAAESEFVGVPCGIMDPFASALGRRDAALRIDCRSQDVSIVPWPGETLRLLIAHSGVHRSLADGGFADRRRECAEALAAARAAGVAPAGASALRDLGEQHLPELSRALEPIAFRRARHVIRENARVDSFCAALATGELEVAGSLLRDGMRSLREDFDVSTPELDALCEFGDSHPGVYGSRLTGAGFGGCTLHLVEPAAADEAVRFIAEKFETRFGNRPSLQVVHPADGAQIVD